MFIKNSLPQHNGLRGRSGWDRDAQSMTHEPNMALIFSKYERRQLEEQTVLAYPDVLRGFPQSLSVKSRRAA
jgi:hypothetical protein